MAPTYRQRFLGVLAQAERDYAALFADLTDRINAQLVRTATLDGAIPLTRAQALRDAIGAAVTATFLGGASGGELRPFQVVAGRVVPLSPYMTVLWRHVEAASRVAVDQHAAQMRQHLHNAPDVLRALERATVNPFARTPRVAEQADFNPRPFLSYDPLHRFVRPDGYTLSDRIWRTSVETRRKIDQLLTEGIAQGKGALELANELEAFLQPGRGLRVTNKPYGTTASADAMRLARTEIAAAHARAGLMSANLNPFVGGYQPTLSRQHPKLDECDEAVAGGPYPLDDLAHLPPYHPHCVTPGQTVETKKGPVPIEMVRAGDFVRTHTGRWGKVLKAWSRPFDGTVYKFSTESGQFELTGEHPVLLARGWVKAEDIQLGDQVVYAQTDVLFDSVLSISEDVPTHRGKKSVASLIAGNLARRIMPPASIALNGNLNVNQGEINGEAANGIFSNIDDSAPIQFGSHRALNTGGDAVSSHGPRGFKCCVYSWVVLLFGAGNLFPNLRALGGVVFSPNIQLLVQFTKKFARCATSSSVILTPRDRDSLADGSQRDVAEKQQAAEHAEADAEFFAYGGRSHLPDDVILTQDSGNGTTKLAFDTQGVVFGSSDVVRSDMSVSGAELYAPTDGTNMLHADNLSSLPLRDGWGTAPRNAGVGRFMTPPQARPYYTTVHDISTRHYIGPVYNMHVDGDNSYTVNGACVHNCLCYCLWETVESSADVIAELHAQVEQQTARLLAPAGRHARLLVEMIGPLLAERFVQLLLGEPEYVELAA